MSKYVVNGEILGLTVKYTVDTEARTVTGIIDDIHLQTKVLDELNNQLMSTSAISEISNCLLLNETIEVIVECRPEDSFSADFGVQLAQRRLTDKINRYRETVLLEYYEYLNKQVYALEKCLKKYPMSNRAPRAMADFHSRLCHGYGSVYK